MKQKGIDFDSLHTIISDVIKKYQQYSFEGIFDVVVVEDIPHKRAFLFPKMIYDKNYWRDPEICFRQSHYDVLYKNLRTPLSVYFDGEHVNIKYSQSEYMSAEYEETETQIYIVIFLKGKRKIYSSINK